MRYKMLRFLSEICDPTLRKEQLQWRNWLAHGTYTTVHELCRGCEFEPRLEQLVWIFLELEVSFFKSCRSFFIWVSS